MEDLPTERERLELEKLGAAGKFHLKLMVATVACFGGIFIVPESMGAVVAIPSGVLLLVFVVSQVNMQFFQKCPRCSASLSRISPSCVQCGLKLVLGQKEKGDGNEWKT